ncbi:MAG: hypothetical protein ABI721_01255 [Candidatus Dojkabacteria bacterium]
MNIQSTIEKTLLRRNEHPNFKHAYDLFIKTIETLPLELRPKIDPNKVYFCTTQEYIDINTSYFEKIGKLSLYEAKANAISKSTTNGGCLLRDTGEILIRYDPNLEQIFRNNLEALIHYLRILSHEAGHTVLTSVDSVSLEVAAKVNLLSPEVFKEFLRSHYNLEPEECRFGLYGNMIDMTILKTGRMEEVGIGRNKRLIEITPDIYMQYICFLNWAEENNINTKDKNSIILYARSKHFQAAVTADELTIIAIVRAASIIGFERLVKLFVTCQDIFADQSTIDLSDSEIIAVTEILQASQLQELVHESIAKMDMSVRKDVKTYLDLAFLALRQASKSMGAKTFGRVIHGTRESVENVTVESDDYTLEILENENIILQIATTIYTPAEDISSKELIDKARALLMQISDAKRGVPIKF